MQPGARQWRTDCECLEGTARSRDSQHWERQHSEVSSQNLTYFVGEDRLLSDLDADALEERLKEADGTLVCCNVCGRLKEVQG